MTRTLKSKKPKQDMRMSVLHVLHPGNTVCSTHTLDILVQ
jgi:hypothetical protein